MVKGVSRQVILVRPQDQKMFEQAIFILREDAEGITDEMLLQEAKAAIRSRKTALLASGPAWACGGALCTGLVWLLTVLL